MTVSSLWKDNEDEAIDITKDNLDEEPNWKVVGSHSRRESFSQHQKQPSPPSQQQEIHQRNSIITDKQWGSFGNFQWEGPSIFDEEINTPKPTPLPPNMPDQYYDPNVIPMLPNIPLEPIYRQQRSFSFSMGQDPAFFGYDDYSTRSSSLLATTLEEDEEQQDYSNGHPINSQRNSQLSLDDAYFRTRSQSSNAAFGLYSPLTSSTISSTSSTYWNTRRSSMGFIHSNSPTSLLPPSLADTSKENIVNQRRMSQPFNTNLTDYSFPEIIPNGIIPTSNNSFMNSSSVTTTSNSNTIQNLTDMLENTYLTPDDPQDTGKGLSLQKLAPHVPLYMVEFKSGRTDYYYVSDLAQLNIGDLVIVEADRGKDLGKIATDILSINQVLLLQQQQQNNNSNRLILDENNTNMNINDIFVKKIYRKAVSDEINLLLIKEQDEQKALSICLQKIKNRKLQMEVVDAEFQWDRRKLTFYFIAERRIDFRELVRELFKIYKTRIWMCAVNPTIPIKSVTTPSNNTLSS